MSYDIFYHRAFIKVLDKFVPLINKGSNNCWDRSPSSGRLIPEKNWLVLNWRARNKLVYSREEICAIAKDYKKMQDEAPSCFKTRNTIFTPEELERWIINGMKSAFTIEEYIAFGNRLYLHDYSANEISNWKQYPFQSTEEFLQLLEKLSHSRLLNVHFANEREVYKPKKVVRDYKDLPVYFVLAEKGKKPDVYLQALRKRRGYYTTLDISAAKAFPTEKAAKSYISKYPRRLSGHIPIKISQEQTV